MRQYFVLIVAIFTFTSVQGQTGWMSFPAEKDNQVKATDSLDFTKGGGKVTVHQDPRMDAIGAFLRVGEEDIEGVKIDGFRVLIFFDPNRSLTEQKKAAFIRAYPEHSTYVDFMAPNYRVRVGNFRTKLEAEAMKAQLIGEYPTAIVVQDKIQLPDMSDPEK